MASIELEPTIKQSLRYLHSSAIDSTEQLRFLLDDLIRQSHGSSKTLANVLPKKYITDERNESQRHKSKGDKPRTLSVQPPSPQQIQIPERDDDDLVMDQELAFDLLKEDLICVVCRQIEVQAGNRLVECDVCHSLYHQDCHKPVISDEDISSQWCCATCLASQAYITQTNYTTNKVSHSASNSVKSSPSRQSTSTTPIKVTSSATASSSSKVVTPNINIISADKRLQIMKKKAAKQQEKRKHSK